MILEKVFSISLCQLRLTALDRLIRGGIGEEAPAAGTEEPAEPDEEQVSPGATTESPTLVVPADNVTVVGPNELERRWYHMRLKEVEEPQDEYVEVAVEEMEEAKSEVKEEQVKEEKVIPSKSVKRKEVQSGMAQPVVPRPSKCAKASTSSSSTLPPMPPPPGPPPSDAGSAMAPPTNVPMKKSTGWLNKAVVLAYLVKEDKWEEAKKLVKKYEDRDKNFRDTLVQHSGLMRSSGSDPKRDYMTRLK